MLKRTVNDSMCPTFRRISKGAVWSFAHVTFCRGLGLPSTLLSVASKFSNSDLLRKTYWFVRCLFIGRIVFMDIGSIDSLSALLNSRELPSSNRRPLYWFTRAHLWTLLSSAANINLRVASRQFAWNSCIYDTGLRSLLLRVSIYCERWPQSQFKLFKVDFSISINIIPSQNSYEFLLRGYMAHVS